MKHSDKTFLKINSIISREIKGCAFCLETDVKVKLIDFGDEETFKLYCCNKCYKQYLKETNQLV